VAQKRGLFSMIFGKKSEPIAGQYTQLKMLSGFSPFFSDFGENAYESDVVRAAVDAIARNAAKLKPKHVRRSAGQVTLLDSTLERLLNVRPNAYMDSFTFLYKVVTQLYMSNNAFIYVDKVNESIKGFYPIPASQLELIERNDQVYARFRFLGGDVVTLPYDQVIHLRRFFYRDDFYGERTNDALKPTLQLLQTANDGIINSVKSSAYLRGLLKFTSMLKPEDMKKQRDLFVQDYMDITNNGGIAATDAKAEYVDLKSDPKMISAEQMKLIEDKVYKYFNVNESIVKSDYTESQWAAFYESVIEPIAIQLSLEFTTKIFTSREQGFGNEIIFEANRLQYASTMTKLRIVNTLMDRGLLSMNEAREIFNLSPIEDGDKRIVSLNFVDAAKANEYQLGQQAPKGVDDDDDQDGSGV
jgi:HK97 family phage portal protein